MPKFGGWEPIEPPLGSGGQGTVYKARTPARVAERTRCFENFRTLQDFRSRLAELAEASWLYARPELPSELGALKIFDIPTNEPDASEAIGRLKNEIAVLRENRRGLIRLLDANEGERWMVTELMPGGTIEKHPDTFKGNALGALKAFRSLVETVATLHKEGKVHRDIKPANVFIRGGNQLVLGDFGIVYLPDQGDRLTCTNERVGSRDYMPTWANTGERLEQVEPNFDVYMLGKLLWCMIAGRLKLPLWYHNKAQYDLATKFPDSEHMRAVNFILDKCIVEFAEDCLTSGQELLKVIDETLATLERGIPRLDRNGRLVLPCRMCGKGYYRPMDQGLQASARLLRHDQTGANNNPILVRAFVCNVCTHYEFFAPNFPEEAAEKGWTKWKD